MKKTIKMKIDGREVTVEAERTGNLLTVQRDDERYEVELVQEKAAAAKPVAKPRPAASPVTAAPVSAPAPVASGGAGTVPAPMTGTTKELLVSVGDAVTSGQQILIMEAMKMDIEVAAPSGGTVKEIYVKPGDSIKENQPLMKIE